MVRPGTEPAGAAVTGTPAGTPTGTPTGTAHPGDAARAITCGLCGRDFVEDTGQAACQACPLSRACGLVRCPHCGYENPRTPAWIDRVRSWIGR